MTAENSDRRSREQSAEAWRAQPAAARPQNRRSREHPADARRAQARRCEAAASRKAKVAELLAQDRQKLLMKLPFTGSLVMRLDLVPVSDVRLETASTDGDRIFVDVDFYSKLGAAERLFVLAHEVWHCALLHFLRRQNRDRLLFNIAADLEIHFLLTDEGFEAPFVLPHDPRWKGLSAEEIYERLLTKDGFRMNGRESEHVKGLGEGEGFDRHLDSGADAGIEKEGAACGGNDGRAASGANGGKPTKGFDPDYTPRIAAGAAERCRERLTSAVQQAERTRGTLPAGLKRIVEAVLRPEIGWKELLAQFVTSCYGGSRRWLPPARRHVWQGLYLQSRRSEKLRAVVAVDTSGSTSDDLPSFFSELNALLGTFGAYELTVIQCDATVGAVETFDDASPLPPNRKWKATGGGGTDFRPVFRYVDEHPGLDPALLIYFTDGFGDCPERPPAYPVMWLLTKDGREQPWGQSVHFKNPCGGGDPPCRGRFAVDFNARLGYSMGVTRAKTDA